MNIVSAAGGHSRRARQLRLLLRGVPRSPREFGKSMVILGSLREAGWQRSSHARRSIDDRGSVLPWLTYPAIEWLAGRSGRIHSVLEFGAGASTLWFAARGADVYSIEHDGGWIDELVTRFGVPPDRLIAVASDEEAYVGGLSRLQGQTFDLVVIDGLHRHAAAAAVRRHLHAASLLCLDDSQRREYASLIDELHREGFRSIGMSGFAPIVADQKETRFFSRRLDLWMDGGGDGC